MMWRFRRWWRSAVVVVVAAVAAGTVSSPASASEEIDRAAVDRLVADVAADAGYSGVAVAITRGAEVLYTAGYGRVSASTPMPVASVSKSFTEPMALPRAASTGENLTGVG